MTCPHNYAPCRTPVNRTAHKSSFTWSITKIRWYLIPICRQQVPKYSYAPCTTPNVSNSANAISTHCNDTNQVGPSMLGENKRCTRNNYLETLESTCVCLLRLVTELRVLVINQVFNVLSWEPATVITALELSFIIWGLYTLRLQRHQPNKTQDLLSPFVLHKRKPKHSWLFGEHDPRISLHINMNQKLRTYPKSLTAASTTSSSGFMSLISFSSNWS